MPDGGGLHVLWIPSWYPSPNAPATGIFFAEQARALRAAGVRVGIVYPEFRSLRTMRPGELRGCRFQASFADEGGIPTYRLDGWNVVPRLVLGGRLWSALARRLARRYVARFGRPDLVHAHAAMWGGLAAAAVAAELGVPYVVTEHFSGYTEHYEGLAPGIVTPGQLRAVRKVYHGARRVVAVSSALGTLLGRVGLADPARVRVIPNLVHTDFFVPPPRPREAGGALRILAVGTLEERKAHGVLLEAFARAFGAGPGVELLLGGSGPLADALAARARELGLEGRVRMLGQLDREQVREAMWSAHLFVLPSHVETFSVVLIEAMATGLPLVATACGGPGDIVVPGVGRLVPPNDPAALASALREAADEAPRADPERIRRSAVERFSAEAVTGRVVRMYREVLAEPGVAG
jgi:glycosyltransferase involved in cell wall biosynthesis